MKNYGRPKRGQQPPSSSSFFKNSVQFKTIDDYINWYLDQEDAKNEKQERFFKHYYQWLQSEREKHIEDILESLELEAKTEVSEVYTRIVFNQFNHDPLCTVGSIKTQGQRFNIGSRLEPYKEFHCLYLANDFPTAYAEVFHKAAGYRKGSLSPHELAGLNGNDFSSFSVKVSLEKCLDLRDPKTTKSFVDIISNISVPKEILQLGQEAGVGRLRTIRTSGELKRSLLDEGFLKIPTILDLPSNSQWFGYYALKAGIQGLIFESVRFRDGINLAVFPDNLAGTDSFLELNDANTNVHQSRRRMDKGTYEFRKIPSPKDNDLNHH